LGEDFVRQLYVEQKAVFISDYRLLGEWLARGNYLIGLGALERFVEPFRKEGLPVGFIGLEDAPGYVTGGASLIKLMKGSPHPYGAVVLLNWLASREGQEAYSRAALQPSRRVDVNVEGIPDYMVPRPGIKYIDAHSYDFYVHKRGDIDSGLKRIIGDR
jgi:ABC-type Fe3+ transport system substrate-binding protein